MQEEIKEAGINVQKILQATIKRTNHSRLMQNLIVFLTLVAIVKIKYSL